MPRPEAAPIELGIRRHTFSPDQRRILADYWHPVASSDKAPEGAMTTATLLDVDLVIYRLDGRVHVGVDYCPHRGARLSLGRVTGAGVMCGYHGMEFDRTGRCTLIPADTENALISERLRMNMVAAEERYGLIWVCLSGEPRMPLPDWSAIEQPGNQRIALGGVWEASALRHLENFCDLAHLTFVHGATFAAPGQPHVAPYAVERRPHGLYFDVMVPMVDEQIFTADTRHIDVRTEYDVTFPFATRLTLHLSQGVEHICDVVSPVAAGRSEFFMLKSRDHDQDHSAEDWFAFQAAVNEEDRALVESQTPDWPAFSQSNEVQVGSDRFSVAFRKYWFDQGLGRDAG